MNHHFECPSPGYAFYKRPLQRWRGWRASRSPTLLSQQIARLRWQVPLFALLLVLLHQGAEHLWLTTAHQFNFVSGLILYGFTGPLVVWLAMGWIQRRVIQKESAEAELVQAHNELTRLNRRVSFLFKVSQRLDQSADEEQLAQLLLQLPREITSAVVGCALVRLDDQHQPMPIEYRDALDEAMLEAWHQHLASRGVQFRCGVCQLRQAKIGQPCPLFEQLPLQHVGSIVCLSLERGGRRFAILGLFLERDRTLTDEERDLLEAVTTETAIALENMRLRTRELRAIYEINETLQSQMDLDGLMARLLTQTMEASSADAGLLMLQDADGSLTARAAVGDWNGVGHLPLVESLAAGALHEPGGEPVVAALGAQIADSNTTSILCAPLIADGGPLGAIMLGSRRREAFSRQQVRLVSAIARQTALVAQNARLYAQLEHQAILAERGRLAREIHDGVAQVLGYLKLRAGQIAGWLEAGQNERTRTALRELTQTVNEAYVDLRAALDGLRLTLDAEHDADLITQLRSCVGAFEDQSGLTVALSLETNSTLPISARYHLLRILQEALTNIRKHANAHSVRVALKSHKNLVQLLVEDDGKGFDAGRDQAATHHGLRLMRERAELLGAQWQVTSAPGEGTRVCLQLPMGTDCDATLTNRRRSYSLPTGVDQSDQ